MIPLCKEKRVSLIPYSPLARGFLTGKYRRGENPEGVRYSSEPLLRERFFRPGDFDVLERVVELARNKGGTPAQVALAWHLHKGVTAPIIGATKVEHIEEAVASLDVRLMSDEVRYIEEPYQPKAVIGHS